MNLDPWIPQPGQGPWMVLFMAILLGLRHATDPDHIAAVSTLVLGDRKDGERRARTLSAMWGLGHGATLVAFGLPIILFRRFLPDALRLAAEVTIGAVIVVLAIRLLLRWRRGYFHAHPHDHGGVRHVHPHLHEHGKQAPHPETHQHRHADAMGRSPLAAFGIGLIHGVGGSAGTGILLVSASPSTTASVLALVLFALSTAAAMVLITGALGALLARNPAIHRLGWLIPAFGIASLSFGVWYGLDALAVFAS